MFSKTCKVCETLRQENTYLKTLVDKLLNKQGIAGVTENWIPQIDETEDEKLDRALKERGAVKYGD